MTSRISIFGTSIKSEILGTTSSYSLTSNSSNLYKNSTSASIILDYQNFGKTWVENRSVPKGYMWTSVAISYTNPQSNLNIRYGQFQSLTYENNIKNKVAIIYSYDIGKTWRHVNMKDVDLLGNNVEPLYKWSNLKMSDDGRIRIVIANDKYLFKSVVVDTESYGKKIEYGVKWVLDQELYNNVMSKKINSLKSIAMSIDGNNIYVSGQNQPLYVWRNNNLLYSDKIAKIISASVLDATNAQTNLSSYINSTTNKDMGVLYYYYGIILDAANIAYTVNNKIKNTQIDTIVNTTIQIFNSQNIVIPYTQPKINNSFIITSGWSTDVTTYNNSIVGCSYDGNVITTVSQTNYPYNNTLVITTNDSSYLSTNITLFETILTNINNNQFFELNTSTQRLFQIAMSNTGQYQTIVLLNNENIKTNSINYSTTGILYTNDYGNTWQYATDATTKSVETLKKINWTSIAVSYSGLYQTAVSAPSYINKNGYVYYSTDYGATWTQSSGKTGAPSKYWTGVSITKNAEAIISDVNNNLINSYDLKFPEGFLQIATSKDGKIYVSKFYDISRYIKEIGNGGASDVAQLISEIDDTGTTQNTIVN